jgi:hypothetical protein
VKIITSNLIGQQNIKMRVTKFKKCERKHKNVNIDQNATMSQQSKGNST